MDSFPVKLIPSEFDDLNRRFPKSAGSNQIGQRAPEILKIHFQRVHPGCEFVPPAAGADLAVIINEAEPKQYEVKGTETSGVAWNQLKVSSQASYDLLVSGRATVLRVTKVFDLEPVVFVLRCGQDFRLEPEARWCVKPIRQA